MLAAKQLSSGNPATAAVVSMSADRRDRTQVQVGSPPAGWPNATLTNVLHQKDSSSNSSTIPRPSTAQQASAVDVRESVVAARVGGGRTSAIGLEAMAGKEGAVGAGQQQQQ